VEIQVASKRLREGPVLSLVSRLRIRISPDFSIMMCETGEENYCIGPLLEEREKWRTHSLFSIDVQRQSRVRLAS
jgi:hypothetical protein